MDIPTETPQALAGVSTPPCHANPCVTTLSTCINHR